MQYMIFNTEDGTWNVFNWIDVVSCISQTMPIEQAKSALSGVKSPGSWTKVGKYVVVKVFGSR